MRCATLLPLIAFIQYSVMLVTPACAQADLESDASHSFFPSQVSTKPGKPTKPVIKRPGDRNVSAEPALRYKLADSVRSGYPQTMSEFALPAMNANYSAGYAGGSTIGFSSHSRPRNHQEGTWGLDFTLWGQPRLAWLRWSDGSIQKSNGNFETDR